MFRKIRNISLSVLILIVLFSSTGHSANFSNWVYRVVYSSRPVRITQPSVPSRPSRPSTPVQPETPEEPAPTRPVTPKPEEPKPAPQEPVASSIEKEILNLVNIERQKNGLSPMVLSSELSRVAKAKSQDMADKNYFSHTSPTYGDPFNMMRSFGIKYTTAGENIAKGYSSAQSVMRGWMNSSGHRANILNPRFGTLGVGYVEKNGTTYWTQMFTN